MAKILKKISETEFTFDGSYYEFQYIAEPNPLDPLTVSLVNNGSGISIQTFPNLVTNRYLYRDGVKLEITVNFDPFLKNLIKSMSPGISKFNINLVEDIKNAHRMTFPEEYI